MGVRAWRMVVLAAFCLAAIGRPALALEPERAGQEAFLKRAAFAEDRLWLLSDAGGLSSISFKADRRAPEAVPGNVLDLCGWRGRIAILTSGNEPEWALYLHQPDGGWARATVIAQQGERLVGMTCSDGEADVLTDRRLLRLSGDSGVFAATSTALKGELRAGLITSLYPASDAVWVGVDAGEWGGGLSRIDRGTGAVQTVESNATGDLCDGPLNTECDPVNGIEGEPWAPGCIAVSVGLEHMLAHGRLVEVCAGKIRTLFEAPLGRDLGRNGKPLNTVPFFGMLRVGDELLVAGADGLYRVQRGVTGRVSRRAHYKNVDGVYVNFDDPHFVLVLTEINRRDALSGLTPMMVRR